jgi:hypothetical protein
MKPTLAPTDVATSRRNSARQPSSRPLPRRLCAGDAREQLDAWILDLSVNGIGLVVDKPVEVGTLLLLELETCPQAAPLTVWANVVHCQPTGDGEYRIGCQFVTPLADDDLEVLLQ